jgi:uncharacterized membrane protein
MLAKQQQDGSAARCVKRQRAAGNYGACFKLGLLIKSDPVGHIPPSKVPRPWWATAGAGTCTDMARWTIMRRFIVAFLVTALVTAAVVYTFATGPRNHTQVVEQQ